tara:strand:+ start:270 stop:1634 length:1365 start_codon:yes stop_codon:yes gene_type:complete
MAKEIPLYKDKKYVKLITETLDKLTEGYKNKAFWIRPGKTTKKYLNKTLYNRVYNALITQPDKAFIEVINNAIKNNIPIAQLAQQLKTKEDSLLSENKPLLGTEAHHIFHQNTVKRIRKFPIAQQLEIMHKFRKLGGTSGVVPANLTFLGKMAHRANLLKDVVKEVTAHINPFTLKDDTGYWSDDYEFDPEKLNLDDLDPEKLSLDKIAEALYDEAYGPQKMLAKYAGLRKSQVKARQWFKDLLGGTDLFDPKYPASVLNKYKKILSNYEIPDFGVISEAFEKGKTPKLPTGKILSEIEALNKLTSGVNYNLGFGDLDVLDLVKRNAAGEVVGALADAEVHKKALKGDYKGAAVEGVKGAVIGGATQSVMSSFGVNATALAPAVLPIAARNIANVYSQHYTGQDLEEHVLDIDKETDTAAGSAGLFNAYAGGSGPNTHLFAGYISNMLRDKFKK